jgi:branched-chain amino acid transport system substrate-binding protein
MNRTDSSPRFPGRRRVRPAATMAAAAAALLALSAACSSATATTATGQSSASGGSGNIVLGGLFDETGLSSVLGTEELPGAEAAVKAVNAAGGVIGKKITFDVQDTASDPQQAVQAARNLVADHVSAVIGPTTSSSGLPTLPVLAAAHIPSVNTAGLSTFPQVTDKTYVFDALPSTPIQTQAVFKYWQSAGITRVTMIGAATASLDQLEQLFSPAALKPYGITLLKTVSYPPGTADLTASLTAVAATHPQFIYAASFGSDEITLFKQVHSVAGLTTTPVMGTAGTISPAQIGPLSTAQTVNLYSPVWRTVVASSLTGDEKAAADAYLAGMKTAGFTPDPTSTAVGGWDAVMLAVDAIKKAGSTDGAAIQKAMENQSYVGAVANWHKTPDNHMGAAPSDVPIAEWKNGSWVPAQG